MCDKIFSDKFNLVSHKRMVHEGVKISCDLCFKTFSAKRAMELHMSNVHEGFNLEEYKCQECDRNFTTNGSLKSHQIVHDQNRIRYECNKCQKSFSHEEALVKHIKSIHAAWL